MKIKALRSFCGKISMRGREIREVDDEIARDLIQAGHAVLLEEDKKGVKTTKKAKAKAETPKAEAEPDAEPAPEAETEGTNNK